MSCRKIVICLGLSACGAGDGEWVVETWGEEYIEQGLPSEIFDDGCSVVYDTFLVSMGHRALIDGSGTEVGDLGPAQVFDLVVPGPVPMGAVAVPADHYSSVSLVIAPDPDATAGSATDAQTAEIVAADASVLVDGELTCGTRAVHFRWAFDASTTYDCEPTDLTIPAGGADGTQITIHGDHLFYDGLENADAVVRGQAVVDADGDGDGEVTLAELDAVSIPALGYDVGEYSDVLTLRAFVSHLTRTIGHIDGEGECRVDF